MPLRGTARLAHSKNILKVNGDLTMRRIARPVIFDVTYLGPSYFVGNDNTYTTYGINAITSVRREDFHMTWNLDIEGGVLW